MGLQRLLDLEDDPGFVDLTCPTTGVLAWPAVRQDVFRLLLGDRLYGTPIVDLAHRPVMSRLAAAGVRARAYNVRHRPQRSDVLIVSNGAGLIPRDGRSFNRYIDYFASSLGERAWTAESLFGDTWPILPRANRRLGFTADHRLHLGILARVSVRAIHRRIAGELIDLAARRGRDRLGWDIGDVRRAALVAAAARRLAGYPIRARYINGLLTRIRPRLVIAQESCYGHMAVLNATARERGVAVAEFQHGLVTPGHDAYNVAPTLAQSAAYRLTQPEAFLGYGQWWNDQFNAPVDAKVVIGNPHRSEVLRSWRPKSVRSNVVVLGDGFETDAYLSFCRRLNRIVPDPLRVLFRPHPVERARVGRGGHDDVEIDQVPDLYESLASAEVVVGEASTALFEAIGLVPRIFVWDTDKSRFYLGDHPFERFADPDNLATMLATDDRGRLSAGVADGMWADNWRERFIDYVAMHS